MTRRDIIKRSALLTLIAQYPSGFSTFAALPRKKLRISACDWSLGKNSDPDAFDIARQIGLAGIQVNVGSAANNLHLRDKRLQQRYLDKSRETGIEISSIALAELNNVPYKSDPQTEPWVSDSIDVARALGVKVILLAFFHKNDLRDDSEGKKEVIRRLRKVAPKAEDMGVELGIESYLSAPELLDIIGQVGSRNIKVYYDFRNAADAGYDVIQEVKMLGKDLICELHMKENGFLLGQGTLDWKKIAKALTDIDYIGDGWMQIEGANPEGAEIAASYQHNLKFLQDTFHL